jgi:hypothetical protein
MDSRGFVRGCGSERSMRRGVFDRWSGRAAFRRRRCLRQLRIAASVRRLEAELFSPATHFGNTTVAIWDYAPLPDSPRSAQGGSAMERCLFSVAEKQLGWQLADQDSIDQWYLDKSSAIRAADCMALVRYEQTGHPTGIKVQMATGEWVLMGLHG